MESAAPFYFVGALAGAEAGEGASASMRLRLEQSAAQAQASRAPPAGAPAAGGAVPARSCSVFFDPAKFSFAAVSHPLGPGDLPPLPPRAPPPPPPPPPSITSVACQKACSDVQACINLCNTCRWDDGRGGPALGQICGGGGLVTAYWRYGREENCQWFGGMCCANLPDGMPTCYLRCSDTQNCMRKCTNMGSPGNFAQTWATCPRYVP